MQKALIFLNEKKETISANNSPKMGFVDHQAQDIIESWESIWSDCKKISKVSTAQTNHSYGHSVNKAF